MKKKLYLNIKAQPDNTSCGPTCLHSVYNYYGDVTSLEKTIEEVVQFKKVGGTLAVILGQHALKKGYEVDLYSYNLNIFDPSWFALDRKKLISKLKKQGQLKYKEKKLCLANDAYLKFLQMGGNMRFGDLNADLIKKYLFQGIPILTGLSSTYLYQNKREDELTTEDDDVGGYPAGHFVVLCGYNFTKNQVQIADPYILNPLGKQNYYKVSIDRLITSILLGVITYDANLLIIKPKKVEHE